MAASCEWGMLCTKFISTTIPYHTIRSQLTVRIVAVTRAVSVLSPSHSTTPNSSPRPATGRTCLSLEAPQTELTRTPVGTCILSSSRIALLFLLLLDLLHHVHYLLLQFRTYSNLSLPSQALTVWTWLQAYRNFPMTRCMSFPSRTLSLATVKRVARDEVEDIAGSSAGSDSTPSSTASPPGTGPFSSLAGTFLGRYLMLDRKWA